MHRKRRTTIAGLLSISAVLLAPACSGPPKRDAATFCDAYVTAARHGAALPDPDNVSLAALRRQVDRIEDEASKAVEHAPNAIADDAKAVIAPLATLRSALHQADTRTEADKALRAYLADGTSTRANQKRLDAWVAANCHVVPVTTIPTTTLAGAVGTTG